jgi:hypothetical protein
MASFDQLIKTFSRNVIFAAVPAGVGMLGGIVAG